MGGRRSADPGPHQPADRRSHPPSVHRHRQARATQAQPVGMVVAADRSRASAGVSDERRGRGSGVGGVELPVSLLSKLLKKSEIEAGNGLAYLVLMRTVARFQFRSDDPAQTAADDIANIIENWAGRKFKRRDEASVEIAASGRQALFDQESDSVDNTSRKSFSLLEPVAGGHLQTNIQVLQSPTFVAFRATLSLGAEGGLAQPKVQIRSPRFVREVIKVGLPWRSGSGGERVFAQAFDVQRDEIDDLQALIASEQRRLPLVLVSEFHGQTLAGDLHEQIASDVCGLAHTVRLNNDAAWELTNRLGKEWSCYNGAVRLFWPFKFNRDNFRTHPLWTLDRITSRTNDPIEARDSFRNMLSRRLIEASTYVADEPAFAAFEETKFQHEVDEARRNSVAGGDFVALADSYAKENDALRKRVTEQEAQISTLQSNVESLTIALRSVPAEESDSASATEAPPQSVGEAVATARRELVGRVAIATETDDDIAALNAAAGPPEKLLRYLRTLGELSDALESGEPLGLSVPIWLRERGIDCSGDSETAKSRRRPLLIDGQEVDCEFHAKPSDGVSPDLCARVHFGIVDVAPRVRIGYIGRHV